MFSVINEIQEFNASAKETVVKVECCESWRLQMFLALCRV